ncbi:NADPH-dependent FMN reductase Lot6, putative [Talaromyces stipitatus ATCC 10500]|uniref:NADPH-dependent FMN reductase Lot6, putative n=1 Tax=Talaromyces stipitatus (strain ATCC 10500 / CBS 375.48 / QM 6759 / NRRL 1006) TaxID=441959 RepID=B8MS80_TALSN|nr:NADPH-dependent FMN reductase Lot6, putative [Talaromyces stipitatus ATCC 10500]EED12138.1 NADPH-dependent FMN reductase Lot6, putative [Talaromyces stipitatus ATCC 10500]
MASVRPKIAIIVGSQREPRLGHRIARFVQDTLQERRYEVDLNIVDLAAWNLPLYNEPGIPSKIFSPKDYKHEHTRRWSNEIASYQAIVFVTPQYNWGYPASLKNAIDYLFNEWKGKPAMIVSYGGHGGGKAAEQLKQVCHGLRMLPLDTPSCLTFPDKEFIEKVNRGEDFDVRDVFNKDRAGIQERFDELPMHVSILIDRWFYTYLQVHPSTFNM